MEGACGKNPVYHAGKVYCVAAQRIADRLENDCGGAGQVWIIGQEGRLLCDPWQVAIAHDGNGFDRDRARSITRDVLEGTDAITKDLIDGTVRLC